MPEPDDILERAWTDYQAGIEALRQRALASPLAADPADRARLHLWLLQAQAMVHNLAVAPDWACPTLLTSTVFEPNVYGWLMPNPDFFYRYAFIDGARRYRIEGRLGTAHFLEGQAISGLFGNPAIKLLKNYDFVDFRREADGALAVTVGPTPPEDGGNWIATDPAGAPNMLILRECFNDWTGETQASLRIRPLDGAVSTFDPDGPEIALRLADGLRLAEFCYATFGGAVTQQVADAVGLNRFRLLDTSRDADAANPSAGYVPVVYDIAEDEALIVEVEVPKARYWSLHLGDVWMQVADFVHHQSSLNGHQVRLDGDGRARLVIAARDPGVANWLDPVGRLRGVGILRWYFSDRSPVPETRLVKLAELDGHLPPDTIRLDAAERARILAERRDAALRRYGH